MRRRPPITAPVLRALVPRRIPVDMAQVPRLARQDEAGHSADREHALGTPRAPHRSSRHPRSPRLPQPRMNAGAVLQPASCLGLRRPRSPRTTPLTTKPLVRRPCHERPATTRTRPLLRHKPQPHPARPAPTNIHLRPTRPTPTLPVTPRRVSPMTTLTNFQSGSIRSNPFTLFETAGREAKTAAVGWL